MYLTNNNHYIMKFIFHLSYFIGLFLFNFTFNCLLSIQKYNVTIYKYFFIKFSNNEIENYK